MSNSSWAPLESSLSEWASNDIVASTDSPAIPRLWRGFTIARCVVALMLVLLQLLGLLLGMATPITALVVTGVYLVLTLLTWRYLHPPLPLNGLGSGWLLTIGIDLAAFSLLQLLHGSSINFTLLYAMAVLMSAVLGQRMVGLGTAALVTLLLLTDAGLRMYISQTVHSSSQLVQAALTGTALFGVVLLAQQLAQRVTREEARARRSRSSARMHAMVNEVVIEALGEGVLVLDIDGRVHAMNPAASMILGDSLNRRSPPFSLREFPDLLPLANLALNTFKRHSAQSDRLSLTLAHSQPLQLLARTRLTSTADRRLDGLCVMFLQDLRELEARIRTEKLAAMGRMSAAVAHEIRNPLTAISQATALLAEDLHEPGQQRLIDMVQNNATRLARIVDEVLDMARARQQRLPETSPLIPLDGTVQTIAQEWVVQTRFQGLLLELGGVGPVHFELEQLRRILVNLLDNAARYAGHREGAIQITTDTSPVGLTRLRVWSDGAALEPAVQRHLFEPFFSSESRSSGLGLFICRELCERHGASIGYQRRTLHPRGRDGNEFTVNFARHQTTVSQ